MKENIYSSKRVQEYCRRRVQNYLESVSVQDIDEAVKRLKIKAAKKR